jgi:hypothetical protein
MLSEPCSWHGEHLSALFANKCSPCARILRFRHFRINNLWPFRADDRTVTIIILCSCSTTSWHRPRIVTTCMIHLIKSETPILPSRWKDLSFYLHECLDHIKREDWTSGDKRQISGYGRSWYWHQADAELKMFALYISRLAGHRSMGTQRQAFVFKRNNIYDYVPLNNACLPSLPHLILSLVTWISNQWFYLDVVLNGFKYFPRIRWKFGGASRILQYDHSAQNTWV